MAGQPHDIVDFRPKMRILRRFFTGLDSGFLVSPLVVPTGEQPTRREASADPGHEAASQKKDIWSTRSVDVGTLVHIDDIFAGANEFLHCVTRRE